MAKKYNLYPIKTIKDWEGEDWDVYEEIRLPNGLMLLKGRGYERLHGHCAEIILTHELAEFIKQNHSVELFILAEQLGFSKDVLLRFRKRLNIRRKLTDYAWVIAHQDEILYERCDVLFEKYQLNQGDIGRFVRYLVHKVGVIRTRKRARKVEDEIQEKILAHKDMIVSCNKIIDLVEAMDIAVSTATRVHKQMCMEQNLPTTAEKLKQKSAERKQWLLDNQHALLSHDLTIKEISQKFNLTQSQIKWARIDLKKLLNIPKKPLAIVWVRAHQADLEQLSHVELQNKYQMTQGQVRHALRVLKKLKQNET